MIWFSRFKIIAKIQKMQKSKRKVVQRTFLKIVAVWVVALCVLGYLCWDNRAADVNNTYTVQVSGKSVSLHRGINKTPRIKFQQENITYYAIWRNYSHLHIRFIVQHMMNEPQLTLTVLRDADERVVAIRGGTKVYLSTEAYNAWHWKNMLCGLLGVMVFAGTLTVVYGIQLRIYLR